MVCLKMLALWRRAVVPRPTAATDNDALALSVLRLRAIPERGRERL